MKKMHTLRKSFMTLLETLIAISLLSVLLVFVFGFFRELSEMNRQTEKVQKQSFQMRYLESRLAYMFERVVNENERARTFYFYTQPANREFSSSESLILTFNNEVRIDPNFSGDVLGRMYLDHEGRLCLVTWPLFVNDPFQFLHEEVLLNNVVDLKFSFYSAPLRKRNTKDIDPATPIDPEKKTPPKDDWLEEWALSYNQMPSMIKVTVVVAKDPDRFKSGQLEHSADKEKLIFHFVLPSSKNPVYYPIEGMKA